jgi:trafficking protein particle complex subunit 8
LKEIIEDAEGIKVKRNMYAETQREKTEILDAVRISEWNAEMNPIVVILRQGQQLEHDFTAGWVKSGILGCQLTHPPSGLTV